MNRTTLRWMALLAWAGGAGSCGPALDEPLPGEAVNETAYWAMSMPACGSVLQSWNGTAAYSNGANTGTGDSCAGWGTYGLQYQCVELVMRHFRKNWGLSWTGHARSLLVNAPPTQVDVYRNGDRAHPPVPGDMLVWESGTWGHVALITRVRSGAVDIIEQNINGSGAATLLYDGATISARSWGGPVSGWAHAKANRGSGPTPGWDCARSDYGGRQVWTCDGNSRNRCEAGVPKKELCARGCWTAAAGSDDVCVSSAPGWSCAASNYLGAQYWTCSGGSIYRCDASGPTVARCPSGCLAGSVGTHDRCR